MRIRVAGLCVLLALGWSEVVHAVDGVVEVNQTSAEAGGITPSDTPGFPVTLDRPGSYRLTSDLFVPDGTGIVVALGTSTSVASVDLNGFTIGCLGCSGGAGGDGINVTGGSIVIRNGTINGKNGYGIQTAFPAIVSDVIVTNNSSGGLLLSGSGAIVRGCVARGNGNGIECGVGCLVDSSVAHGNVGTGITVREGGVVSNSSAVANSSGFLGFGGSVIMGSTARDNTFNGLGLVGASAGYVQNVFTGNNGGAEVQVSGGTQLGTNFCGTNVTCP